MGELDHMCVGPFGCKRPTLRMNLYEKISGKNKFKIKALLLLANEAWDNSLFTKILMPLANPGE